MKTTQHYSLRKRLIWRISIFSLLLGGGLILIAYKIALFEVDKILDKQMQYVAEERSSIQLLNTIDQIIFTKEMI